MNRIVPLLFAVALVASACGDDPKPAVSVFRAAPEAIAEGDATQLVFAATDAEKLTLDNGIGDVTGKTSVEVRPAVTTTYTLTATRKKETTTQQVRVQVGPAVPAGIKVSAPAAVAGAAAEVTLTAVNAVGATLTRYTGTVKVTSSDAEATLPADVTFAAADQGVKKVALTLRKAGLQTVTATDTTRAGVAGSSELSVSAAQAASCLVTGAPAEVVAGTSFVVKVAVRDAFSNAAEVSALAVTSTDAAATVSATDAATRDVQVTLDTAGDQTVTVTAGSVSCSASVKVNHRKPTVSVFKAGAEAIAVGDATQLVFAVSNAESLSIDNGVGDVTGKTSVEVSPTATTTYTLTATNGPQTTTAQVSVAVGPAIPSGIRVGSSGSAVAGEASSVTLTAVNSAGATLTRYTGTVRVSSSDAEATLPADVTFTSADEGVKTVALTLRKAGGQTVTATDTARAGVAGSTGISVSAAQAATCAISGAPAEVTAGTQLALRVAVQDAFANAASVSALTVASSDAAAALPSTDAATRELQVTLNTAGDQTVTVTAGSLTCVANVRVRPGNAIAYVTLPADALATYPVSATVTVRDPKGNVVTGYAGTVSFTSSDPAATVPADVVFDGTQGGTATVSVTFATRGVQNLMAFPTAGVAGEAKTTVRGLVYTNPADGMGKVRMVVNAAASTAGVVQLDLVSNYAIIGSAANKPEGQVVRGGIYSAGMNLPLSGDRVVAGSPLLVEAASPATPVFNLGAAPKAVAAALSTTGPAANVLLTGVSQKAAGAGAVAQDTGVLAGRTFYSVRLRLAPTATAGTVFDHNGAQANPAFRAAVRNRLGDEVMSNADFALGTLEVR